MNLTFNDLAKLNIHVEYSEDCDGDTIADIFNDSCEYGLEIIYIGDSIWSFIDDEEAQKMINHEKLQG